MTHPQGSGALDERAAFEAWRRRTTKMDPDASVALHGFGNDAGYDNKITRDMHIGWMARAALAGQGESASPIPIPHEEDIGIIELAKLFHETYERLAPVCGYETRSDTKAFDQYSANGRLMIKVIRTLRTALAPKQPEGLKRYLEDVMAEGTPSERSVAQTVSRMLAVPPSTPGDKNG